MAFLNTVGAARELGVPATRLYSLLRNGKFRPPEKGPGGDYLWTAADLSRARKALAAGRREGATA